MHLFLSRTRISSFLKRSCLSTGTIETNIKFNPSYHVNYKRMFKWFWFLVMHLFVSEPEFPASWKDLAYLLLPGTGTIGNEHQIQSTLISLIIKGCSSGSDSFSEWWCTSLFPEPESPTSWKDLVYLRSETNIKFNPSVQNLDLSKTWMFFHYP